MDRIDFKQFKQMDIDLVSTLTPREVKVLRRRFGIELEINSEDDGLDLSAAIPPTSGGSQGGQGGAPLIGIPAIPASTELDEIEKQKQPPVYKIRRQ